MNNGSISSITLALLHFQSYGLPLWIKNMTESFSRKLLSCTLMVLETFCTIAGYSGDGWLMEWHRQLY